MSNRLCLHLMLSVAVVVWSGAATAAPAGDCSEPVALDLSERRLAFELTLPGGTTVPAIVDSGAMSTTVNTSFAEALGLKNEGPLRPPFDTQGTGFQSTLTGTRIGSLAVPDHSVAVMPSPLPDKAVILSPEAFRGKLVQLDFQAATMKVCSKTWSGRPRGEGYAYSEGRYVLPAVPVAVGDRLVEAHIDTGSPFALSFPTGYATQFKLAGPLKKAGEAGTHSGPRKPIYAARIDGKVRVGPLTLDSPQVFFTDLSSGANIGTGLLRQLVITLDPEMRRSWVEVAGAR